MWRGCDVLIDIISCQDPLFTLPDPTHVSEIKWSIHTLHWALRGMSFLLVRRLLTIRSPVFPFTYFHLRLTEENTRNYSNCCFPLNCFNGRNHFGIDNISHICIIAVADLDQTQMSCGHNVNKRSSLSKNIFFELTSSIDIKDNLSLSLDQSCLDLFVSLVLKNRPMF